jgi:hypothetical protein
VKGYNGCDAAGKRTAAGVCAKNNQTWAQHGVLKHVAKRLRVYAA